LLHRSVATRIAYALILLVNSILSWIMLTPWAIEKLQHLMLDYVKINCPTGECTGWFAVYRINFALGLFHLVFAGLLFGVTNSKNPRAAIQNGFWGPKVIAWIAFIVLSFLIPDDFFSFWGNYIAFIGAMAFLILGLILLVDLAHTWAEYCLEQIENTDSRVWRFVLIGSTLGMYLASIAMTIVQYIFFASKSECVMNQAAVTINLLFWVIISFISVHPTVQEYNPRAGLAQAAMVAVYCTYLTMSAVSMEPDDKECNPLIRAQGTRTTSVVLGAIVTMLTVAYTTTRAATQSLGLGNNRGGIQLSDDDEHDLVTQQPGRREMRAEVLRRAVEEGSLPADALLSDDEDDDSGSKAPRDDERNSTQYSYTVFHIIFFLATCWVATLLTQGQDMKDDGEFASVGRTYWASWVKIVSAWICYIMYIWTLVAPALLPERFDFA
jgi:hypothetical protein